MSFTCWRFTLSNDWFVRGSAAMRSIVRSTNAVTPGVPPRREYSDPAGATAGGVTANDAGAMRRNRMKPVRQAVMPKLSIRVPFQTVETTHNFTEFQHRFPHNRGRDRGLDEPPRWRM